MNDILLILLGICAGTYYAEEIRVKVPVLDPNKDKELTDGSTL